MARFKKTNSKKKNRKKAIQFQMGWGGLTAIVISTLCVLLWTFIMGFWVGRKLVGRGSISDRNLTVLNRLDSSAPSETPKVKVPDYPVEPAFPPVTAGRETGTLRPDSTQTGGGTGGMEPLPQETIGGSHKIAGNAQGRQAAQAAATEPKPEKTVKSAALPAGSVKKPPAARPETEAKKEVREKTAAKTYFVLQIASYRDRNRAEKEAARWRKKGVTAQVSRVSIKKKGVWYRVYLGRYSSVQEATAGAKRLARKDGIRSYVVPVKH